MGCTVHVTHRRKQGVVVRQFGSQIAVGIEGACGAVVAVAKADGIRRIVGICKHIYPFAVGVFEGCGGELALIGGNGVHRGPRVHMAGEHTVGVILWPRLVILLQFLIVRLTPVSVFYISPHAYLLHGSIAVVGAVPGIEELPVAAAAGSVVEEVQHEAVDEYAPLVKVDVGLSCGLYGSVASELAYKVFLAHSAG